MSPSHAQWSHALNNSSAPLQSRTVLVKDQDSNMAQGWALSPREEYAALLLMPLPQRYNLFTITLQQQTMGRMTLKRRTAFTKRMYTFYYGPYIAKYAVSQYFTNTYMKTRLVRGITWFRLYSHYHFNIILVITESAERDYKGILRNSTALITET